jgi:hypothetical protein
MRGATCCVPFKGSIMSLSSNNRMGRSYTLAYFSNLMITVHGKVFEVKLLISKSGISQTCLGN